jgi:hypothetical protein
MARIRTMTRVSGTSKAHPTEVDAEWSVVVAADGMRYLQLATFGSESRVSAPKVSQTIQLDQNAACELREALDAVFPAESP